MVHQQWNAAQVLKEANAAIMAHVKEISTERALIEENARILMEAEQQRISELNAHTAAREAQRLALNDKFQQRHAAAKAERARTPQRRRRTGLRARRGESGRRSKRRPQGRPRRQQGWSTGDVLTMT
jgi:hypothetical protein